MGCLSTPRPARGKAPTVTHRRVLGGVGPRRGRATPMAASALRQAAIDEPGVSWRPAVRARRGRVAQFGVKCRATSCTVMPSPRRAVGQALPRSRGRRPRSPSARRRRARDTRRFNLYLGWEAAEVAPATDGRWPATLKAGAQRSRGAMAKRGSARRAPDEWSSFKASMRSTGWADTPSHGERAGHGAPAHMTCPSRHGQAGRGRCGAPSAAHLVRPRGSAVRSFRG
jgi:hypothetical protein